MLPPRLECMLLPLPPLTPLQQHDLKAVRGCRHTESTQQVPRSTLQQSALQRPGAAAMQQSDACVLLCGCGYLLAPAC